ncbi:sugar phosphate nucleotidyltransferase [Flavobacteriaceae bacterium]|nr:sugar phosphate nucleotidyltransferase [Flavobacteriaceae bacterium]MDA9879592.1 sugar phosphate nucleotidyltransferase [Flavobacteriaceae bacterium]
MKIIVPMAGRGSRLRPHSLTTPKPLIPVAGIPIVHQLVQEIAKVVEQPITEIGFILGDPAFFGAEVKNSLIKLAEGLGAKPYLFRQDEPLGTGHAIMCAHEILKGPAVVAYADTLIRANLTLDPDADAVIWVKQVEHPNAFGVVELDQNKTIVNLVEKPQEFVSNLAVIGIYYFKEIERLKSALNQVVSKQLEPGEEYQINQGILAMIKDGAVFKTGEVNAWMDCGNPEITIQTNSEMLDFKMAESEQLIDPTATIENSTIIPPCFIGPNAVIKDSTLGPGVSVAAKTCVINSTIKNSLIQENSLIQNFKSEKAMIGNHVHYDGNATFVSIGDYSELR